MTINDFVTYENAVKLKECGFNWQCNHNYCVYNDNKTVLVMIGDALNPERRKKSEKIINAPTLAQAAKWLRDVKGLYVDVWLCAAGWSWTIDKCSSPENLGTFVCKHDEESGDDESSGLWTTYEKALENGISHALEL